MLFEGGADVIPYALEGEIVIFIVITSMSFHMEFRCGWKCKKSPNIFIYSQLGYPKCLFKMFIYQIVDSFDISVGAVTGYRVLAGAADVVYPAELLALVYV